MPSEKVGVKPRELRLGECVQCGGPVVIAMQKGVPLAVYETERFCSAKCAREHHGVTFRSYDAKSPR